MLNGKTAQKTLQSYERAVFFADKGNLLLKLTLNNLRI